MDIQLTPEQSDFVRRAIETGRMHDGVEAVNEAMALWVEREKRRAELQTGLDAAETSLSEGNGIAITRESMAVFTRSVIDRNRHLFAPMEPSSGG